MSFHSLLLFSLLLFSSLACGGGGGGAPPSCPDGIETACGCCSDQACVEECLATTADGGAEPVADGGAAPGPDGGGRDGGATTPDAGPRDGGSGGTACPCQAGFYCDLGTNRCVAGCLADGDCGSGRICENRACVSGCRTDAACGSGRICENRACVSGCRDDAACGAGFACRRPACVPKLVEADIDGFVRYPRTAVSGTSASDVWFVGDTNTNITASHFDGARLRDIRGIRPAAGSKVVIAHGPGQFVVVEQNHLTACLPAMRGTGIANGGGQEGACHSAAPSWNNERLLAAWRNGNGSAYYAVGTRGRIARYTVGALLNMTEARETTTTTLDLNAVWGTGDESVVWAVGTGGVVLRRSGGQWSTVTAPTTQDLFAVHGTSANNVWIAGAGGTVLRWNGSTFEQKNVDGNVRLRTVFCTSASECWVGGANDSLGRAFVQRWNASAWQAPVAPPGMVAINGIYGANANDVWFAADMTFFSGSPEGTILRFRAGTDATPPSGETCSAAIPLREGLDIGLEEVLPTRQDVRLPTTTCGPDVAYQPAADTAYRVTVPTTRTLEMALFPTYDNELSLGGLYAFDGSASVCAAPTSCVASSSGASRNDVAFLRYENLSGGDKTLHLVANVEGGGGGYLRYTRLGTRSPESPSCESPVPIEPMLMGRVDGTSDTSAVCTVGATTYRTQGRYYRVSIPQYQRFTMRAFPGANALRLGIFDMNRTTSCSAGTACTGQVATQAGRAVTYTRNGPAETIISVRAVESEGDFFLVSWLEKM